eukprot:30415-Pelagococcus_subviridis.AAC.4
MCIQSQCTLHHTFWPIRNLFLWRTATAADCRNYHHTPPRRTASRPTRWPWLSPLPSPPRPRSASTRPPAGPRRVLSPPARPRVARAPASSTWRVPEPSRRRDVLPPPSLVVVRLTSTPSSLSLSSASSTSSQQVRARAPRRAHDPRRDHLYERLQGWRQRRGGQRAVQGGRVHARQAREGLRVRAVQAEELPHEEHEREDVQGGGEASDRGRGKAHDAVHVQGR